MDNEHAARVLQHQQKLLREPRDLREWRRFARLNQTEAGVVWGVSRMTYARWEEGQSPIPAHVSRDWDETILQWWERYIAQVNAFETTHIEPIERRRDPCPD